MKQRQALYFALRFFGFYILLYGLYYLLINCIKPFEPALLEMLAISVKGLLSLFGETKISYTNGIPSLFFENYPVAQLIPACNGHRVYILFISFLSAFFFPPRLKHLYFIVLGCLALYLGNIIRIASLSLLYYYQPTCFDFVHTYLFQTFFYLMVFGLWMLALKKLPAK
jgi:exosortase family protein XrtF